MPTLLKTIAIAEENPIQLDALAQVIGAGGYELVGTALQCVDAAALVQRVKPQLILMNSPAPQGEAQESLREILSLKTTAVVVMTTDANPGLARQMLDLGVSGYTLKPIDAAQIIPVLESAWHRHQTVDALRAELLLAAESLETRKVIEKAKGILMEQQGFTEAMAHKFLQKMSQEQGIPLKDVCRSVIQVKLLLGRSVPHSKTV